MLTAQRLPPGERTWEKGVVFATIVILLVRSGFGTYAAYVLSESAAAINGPYPSISAPEDVSKLAVTWVSFLFTAVSTFFFLLVQLLLLAFRDRMRPRTYFILTSTLCVVTVAVCAIIFTFYIITDSAMRSLQQVPGFSSLYHLTRNAPVYLCTELFFALALFTSTYCLQRNANAFEPPIRLDGDDEDYAATRSSQTTKRAAAASAKSSKGKAVGSGSREQNEAEHAAKFAITDSDTEDEISLDGDEEEDGKEREESAKTAVPGKAPGRVELAVV